MAKIEISVVHDELGRILSIARPSKDARVVILSGGGQSVFVTQVDEEICSDLVNSHRVESTGARLCRIPNSHVRSPATNPPNPYPAPAEETKLT